MFAHDFLGAFAIVEKAWISDLAFKLLETYSRTWFPASDEIRRPIADGVGQNAVAERRSACHSRSNGENRADVSTDRRASAPFRSEDRHLRCRRGPRGSDRQS